MTALTWRVKTSLLRYLAGPATGEVEVSEGAEMSPHGILFPLDDMATEALCFRGTASLIGHGGMLRIVIADPAVHHSSDAGGWTLWVRHGEGRIAIAEIEGFTRDAAGVLQGGPTTLTAAGVDLFGGQYAEGTRLDSPSVRPDS
ncbi:HtaA domain-containing protein [Microbacterium sp.]|uniref:HtaA domain-containing protein n=1 Tax=Microbacterium sp. TaxID=51671 RepID=UPI0039E2AD41